MQHASHNPLGLNFHGSWLAAALVAVLAPVYIFYGFESAGDIAEETKDAGRQIPKAMRMALIYGGIASLILTGALLLAMPAHAPVAATVKGGGVPFILGQLSEGMQDFLLCLIIFAFFSCGTSIQGAGSRLAFSLSRDGGRNGIVVGVLVETDIDRWVKRRYRRRGRRLEHPDTGDLGVVDDRRQRIIRRRCGTLARHVNGNGDHAFVDVDAYSLLLDIHLAKAPEKRHVADNPGRAP